MHNMCGTPDKPLAATVRVRASGYPAARDSPQVRGAVADGCCQAIDLGESDRKTVAVRDNEDNEVLFSTETEWDVMHEDPQYHCKAIMDAMQVATIGGSGSATRTISADSDATWGDSFPIVPPPVYNKEKAVCDGSGPP